MTQARLEKIVRGWQRRLGLDHWDIIVNFEEPCPNEADATTWRSNTYDRAVLYWDTEWQGWGSVQANRLVVHELLHLVTRDLDVVHDSVEERLHKEAWLIHDERYSHEIEGVVDRLAYRLVDIGGCL